MDFDEKDDEVIKLLTQLKNTESSYPADMLTSRRQSYMQQMAGLGIGVGAAGALKHIVKGGGGSSVPPIASTLLETALIVAILAEAGAVALINREKVTELFRTISAAPKVEALSTPLEVASPLAELDPTSTSTLVVSGTATPIGTPSPSLFFSTLGASGEEEDGSSNTVPNGNNGNHYGQTPQPERTKQPGGNNDGPRGNSGN